jgi:flagellar biosynthesis component FlhA
MINRKRKRNKHKEEPKFPYKNKGVAKITKDTLISELNSFGVPIKKSTKRQNKDKLMNKLEAVRKNITEIVNVVIPVLKIPGAI